MWLDFFRTIPKTRKVKIVRKSGIIYRNPGFWGHIMFYIANMSLVLAGIYLVYLYYPLGQAIFLYKKSQIEPVSTEVAVLPTLPPKNNQLYTITIPKILAFSEVAEDVSPFNSQEYLRILAKDLVAQAKNTAVPGSGVGQMTYLFAHSTQQGMSVVRNNSVFYLLGQLKAGDAITLDRYGTRHNYKVYKQQVVEASQVEFLKYSEPDKEVLILQTCWPLGTDWKRLLVFAEKV